MRVKLLVASLLTVTMSSTALAADLPNKKGPPAAPPAPVFTWQGGYIGVYAGALLGEGSISFVTSAPERGAGLLGGGTLGYNWQWTPETVIGVEADFGYRGEINSQPAFALIPGTTDSGVLGTLRARAGYAFAPHWLAYATGGFAYGTSLAPKTFSSSTPYALGANSSGATVRAGWTAGAGVEYAWSDTISVKAEYLYVDLVDETVGYATTLGATQANISSAGHIVRAGLNYHFSTGLGVK